MGVSVLPNSFCHFVYPFLFDEDRFADYAGVIDQAQWGEIRTWAKEEFPREELLSHVARYLNPGHGTAPTARLWHITPQALREPEGLFHRGQWVLQLPADRPAIDFRLDDVQLALFNTGVGFLTVVARPLRPDLECWNDFIHYFRFIDGQRRVRLDIRRRTGPNESIDIFPQLAGVGFDADVERTFARIVERLLSFIGEADAKGGKGWREVFIAGQTMPYVGLLLEGLEDEAIAEEIYRLQNFFHARQEIYPGPNDLRLDRASLLPYANRQWFFFSLDGGGFIAANPPSTDFFRETLPDHLRRHYFLLFLIVAHQRYALMRISEDVADQWKLETPNVEAISATSFERIRNQLLSFTARGYFSQVMQREHHHRCYQKWQEIFQVKRLYREVSDEVSEMHGYLLLKLAAEEKRISEERNRLAAEEIRLAEKEWRDREAREREAAQRFEKLVAYLGALIAVPSLVFSFFGINMKWATSSEGLSGNQSLLVIGVAAGAAVLTLVFMLWIIRRLNR